MIIIGITGMSGSGKTYVTRQLADMGGLPIETDPLAHELMKKGQPAYDDIIRIFGTDILCEDGEINRPALGKQVFSDKAKMSQLEGVIHPKVAAKTAKIIEKAAESGKYKFAIIDAPLLIEAGMHIMCDSVWLIMADHKTKCARIVSRDGITLEAAEKRLSSRKGDEILRPHVHIVIDNNDETPASLKQKITAALDQVLKG